jgi:hypothetical protein
MRLASVLATVFVILLLPHATSAVAAAKFEYLTNAAKEINVIDQNAPQLSDDDAGRVAKIACSALKQLTDDPEFNKTLQAFMGEGRFRNNVIGAGELIKNFGAFAQEFIGAEEIFLIDAGVDHLTTVDAIALAARLRNIKPLDNITATQIVEDVVKLRDAACRLGSQIVRSQQARQIRVGIFGVLLVVADAAAGVTTAGVASLAATASVTIGAGIIVNQVSTLAK